MKWLDVIKRRIVWILTGVVVYAALSWLGVAQAQTGWPGVCTTARIQHDDGCRDEGLAFQAALAAAEADAATRSDSYMACPKMRGTISGTGTSAGGVRVPVTTVAICKNGSGSNTWYADRYYIASCSEREPLYQGWMNLAEDAVVCRSGCAYRPEDEPAETEHLDFARTNEITMVRGKIVPTGAPCTDEKDPGPPKDDYCQFIEGGHKICREGDRNCVISGKTGRKYCPAGPGQPLNGTDPNRTENVQQSDPAPAPGNPPPINEPRPGEDFQPEQEGTITNSPGGGGGGGDVTNVTINNNVGTPNTNPNTGNPNDGSGNPGEPGGEEGEGEDDDGDEGEVSGGGDCASPPACSGNPLGCWAIEHNWRIACESSADGLAGIDAMDQAVLDATIDDAAVWGSRLGTDGEGDLDNFRVVKQLDASELDSTGFLGGGSCPQVSVGNIAGVDLGLNLSTFCDMLVNLSGLVMSLSYFLAFRIIAGGGRT